MHRCMHRCMHRRIVPGIIIQKKHAAYEEKLAQMEVDIDSKASKDAVSIRNRPRISGKPHQDGAFQGLQLENKADKAELESALEGKADKAELESALEEKADKAEQSKVQQEGQTSPQRNT